MLQYLPDLNSLSVEVLKYLVRIVAENSLQQLQNAMYLSAYIQ